MAFRRIINNILSYRRPTLIYNTVEGEVGDLELNIPPEVPNSVLYNVDDDFVQPSSDKLYIKIWKKYLFYKEAFYNKFVSLLNSFMEYRQLDESSIGSINSPITFLVDEFVLKFLFAMGFVGQSPVSWLIAAILFLAAKNKTKRIMFWGYLNLSWFFASLSYFIYAINQPIINNPLPRIEPNYKTIV